MSKYIIGFHKGVDQEKKSAFLKDITSNGGQVHSEFDSIGAVSCTLPESYANNLNSESNNFSEDNKFGVRYIEPDGPVSIQ